MSTSRVTPVAALLALLSFGLAAPIVAAEEPQVTTLPDPGRQASQEVFPASSAARAIAGGADVNVSNLAGTEAEVSIDVNPTNPNNLVIVGHAPGFRTMNTFTSTDGGLTWTLVGLGNSEDGLVSVFRFDPTVAFDDNGNVYAGYGAGVFTIGIGSQRTVVVCRSTDGGQTYPQCTRVNTTTDPFTGFPGNDKWHLATGPDPSVPGQQNVYIAWTQNVLEGGFLDQRIVCSGSTDGGANFSAPVILNDTSVGGTQSGNIFADPAVGPGGEVYVAWGDFAANQIFVDVSLDGGATFGTDRFITNIGVVWATSIPAQPHRLISAAPNLDVDRSPASPTAGRLYLNYVDVGSGGLPDTDAVVRFSDDSGTTWSAPTVINDDPGTNSQFLTWLDVDQTNGDVTAVWYDARNDISNQKVDVFQSFSTDGGATFAANALVSDGQSDQSPFDTYGGDYLEYIGIATYNCTSTMVWADNSLDPTNLDFFSDSVTNCAGVGAACMDIKPGSDPNSINPRSKGVIPVAVLGSPSRDVNDIDPATVQFGPNGAPPAHKVMIHFEDVNADGFMDAVFHFRTQATGIQDGDEDACISWTTFAGVAEQCCDDVRTVPAPMKGGRSLPLESAACGGVTGSPLPPNDIIGAVLGYLLVAAFLGGLWLRRRLRRSAHAWALMD